MLNRLLDGMREVLCAGSPRVWEIGFEITAEIMLRGFLSSSSYAGDCAGRRVVEWSSGREECSSLEQVAARGSVPRTGCTINRLCSNGGRLCVRLPEVSAGVGSRRVHLPRLPKASDDERLPLRRDALDTSLPVAPPARRMDSPPRTMLSCLSHRSLAPVSLTGRSHRSLSPVARTGLSHRSLSPVSLTGLSHRSLSPVSRRLVRNRYPGEKTLSDPNSPEMNQLCSTL